MMSLVVLILPPQSVPGKGVSVGRPRHLVDPSCQNGVPKGMTYICTTIAWYCRLLSQIRSGPKVKLLIRTCSGFRWSTIPVLLGRRSSGTIICQTCVPEHHIKVAAGNPEHDGVLCGDLI